jgi:hypothetical protein
MCLASASLDGDAVLKEAVIAQLVPYYPRSRSTALQAGCRSGLTIVSHAISLREVMVA